MRGWVFLCCLVFALSARTETLSLANGEWPPYLSEHYTHHGLASHLVSEAFKLEGIDVEYSFYPWARAFSFVQSGERIGSILWSFNEERARDVLYSEPVIALRTVFFHRKDRSFAWYRLEDLKAWQIVATLGYYYGAEFKRLEEAGTLQVSRVRSDELAFDMLVAGRIDLVAAQFEVGYEILHRRFVPSVAAAVTNSESFDQTDYHLIISRKAPDGRRIIDRFNAGLARLRASGRFDEMMAAAAKGAYGPPQ